MLDAEIIKRLSAVRGISTWTVEMLLIFRLEARLLTCCPLPTTVCARAFALTFQRVPKSRPLEAADLPKPDVMLRRARRWAPYRSVASWYLWRACDLVKKTAPAGRSSKIARARWP